MNWPSTLAPISSPSYKMAEMVKEMSNGRFLIKIDGEEKLSHKQNLLTMVQENTYQMAHSSSENWKNIDLNTIWFTGVPFGMTTTEQYTWFYYGNGQKYMSKVYDKLNILSYPGGNLGSLMGGWSREEIKDISQLKNLQINTQGIQKEILSVYGIIAKNIPSSQIKEEYEKGNIDVINGTSPSMDIQLGYHKIAPYYYTSWDKPAYQMQFLINKKAFEKLPQSYKAILKIAMKTAAYDVYYENFNSSSKAWEKIQTEYPNIEVKSFSKEIIEKLYQAKEFLFKSYAKENKLFNEIYEDQKIFLQRVRPLTKLQEYSYIKTTE
ncbi:MAG: ABC transporter substrate-binding protein [Arcobacteraceae bacterium]